EGSLLCVDVDGTLLHQKLKLRTETATSSIKKSYSLLLDQVLHSFEEISHYSNIYGAELKRTMTTEPSLPSLLNSLGKQAVSVVPFTARLSNSVERTQNQLSNLGYKIPGWTFGNQKSFEPIKIGNFILINGTIYFKHPWEG